MQGIVIQGVLAPRALWCPHRCGGSLILRQADCPAAARGVPAPGRCQPLQIPYLPCLQPHRCVRGMLLSCPCKRGGGLLTSPCCPLAYFKEKKSKSYLQGWPKYTARLARASTQVGVVLRRSVNLARSTYPGSIPLYNRLLEGIIAQAYLFVHACVHVWGGSCPRAAANSSSSR